MKRIVDFYEENKKWLWFSLIAAFVWGLAAHGYCFMDNNVSHDSLNEFQSAILGNDIKIGSGRFFVPLYRDLLRSDVTLPWLIGVLSLLWIGLSVFLVVRIFRVRSRLTVVLIAGIFTVNISVSATAATYLHDLDCNMFSLLCAVGAVYLWQERKRGWLWGIPLLTVSLGIYQSFLFTAAALAMMVCILDLLDKRPFSEVLCHGLKAIAMMLLAGGAYYILLRLVQKATGIALSAGDYNSLDLMLGLTPAVLAQMVVQAYQDFFQRFLNAYSTYPGILVNLFSLFLLASVVCILLVGIVRGKLGWKETLLLVLLAALLPLAMNMIYVLTLGGSHDLMVYSIWMLWLLVVLLGDWLRGKVGFAGLQRGVIVAVVALLLYGSVQFSNGMYLKKDMEHDAYLAMMSRVVARMEACEGYVAGETPVVFVGMPQSLNYIAPGFKDYWNVTGMMSSDVIFMPVKSRYQAYFDYVLGVPLLLAEDAQWTQLLNSPQAEQMPPYPASGCMQMQEGVLLVKLGQQED